MNAEARRVAEAWDPAKDEAAGEECKAFGAAGLMRIPGRLHITWQDDNTLRVDTDAGRQTRLFHFGAARPPGGQPTWQCQGPGRKRKPRPGRAEVRQPRGHDNEPASRISAAKWCSIQRRDSDDRILGSLQRTRGYRLAGHHDHDRRPRVFATAI